VDAQVANGRGGMQADKMDRKNGIHMKHVASLLTGRKQMKEEKSRKKEDDTQRRKGKPPNAIG